jgi:3-phenylpropionate/trans-cinnamate dioxygenase ferredoxin reductase subunit
MASNSIVVVGASLAGLRAAEAIRAGGHEGPLTLIGDEPHRPYERPPLSKGVLQGIETEGSTELTSAEIDADWLLGVEATALSLADREVVLADGRRVPYDRLVIATGSTARTWPGEDELPRGVFTLRGLDDTVALRAALAPARSLVVIGAGFLGAEIAASAAAFDVAVTLVDVAPTPMAALGADVGEAYAELHTRHGVDLRMGTTVARFEATDGALSAVHLQDGSVIAAEVAVVALGGAPAVEWLRDSGLPIEDGVVCDATCTVVGHPDIVAAGDVMSWPHPLAGGDHIRIEHFSNAQMQGRAAGANLLLDPAERAAFAPLPTFWSDQYEAKLQAVGLPKLADTWTVAEGDVASGKLVVVGSREGTAIAAVAVDAGSRLRTYRRLIEQATPLSDVLTAAAGDAKALQTAEPA